MQLQLDFNTRLAIAFIVAIVGLFWQGIIVTTGGEASTVLVGAFSSILLATLGIGVKTPNGSNGNGKKNDERNPSDK